MSVSLLWPSLNASQCRGTPSGVASFRIKPRKEHGPEAVALRTYRDCLEKMRLCVPLPALLSAAAVALYSRAHPVEERADTRYEYVVEGGEATKQICNPHLKLGLLSRSQLTDCARKAAVRAARLRRWLPWACFPCPHACSCRLTTARRPHAEWVRELAGSSPSTWRRNADASHRGVAIHNAPLPTLIRPHCDLLRHMWTSARGLDNPSTCGATRRGMVARMGEVSVRGAWHGTLG